MGDQTHVSTRVMGTYGYAAPEYVMTGELLEAVDGDFFHFPEFSEILRIHKTIKVKWKYSFFLCDLNNWRCLNSLLEMKACMHCIKHIR